jgi:hypothetical protein
MKSTGKPLNRAGRRALRFGNTVGDWMVCWVSHGEHLVYRCDTEAALNAFIKLHRIHLDDITREEYIGLKLNDANDCQDDDPEWEVSWIDGENGQEHTWMCANEARANEFVRARGIHPGSITFWGY